MILIQLVWHQHLMHMLDLFMTRMLLQLPHLIFSSLQSSTTKGIQKQQHPVTANRATAQANVAHPCSRLATVGAC